MNGTVNRGFDKKDELYVMPFVTRFTCAKPDTKRSKLTVYHCKWPECAFTDASLKVVTDHLRDVHNEEKRADSLREVVVTNGKFIGYRCKWPQCDYVGNKIKKHVYATHTETPPFKCNLCAHLSDTIVDLLEHSKTHSLPQTGIRSENIATIKKIDNNSLNSSKSKNQIRADLLNKHIIGTDTVDRVVKEHRFAIMIISIKPESLNRVIGYRCAWTSCDFVAPKLTAVHKHVTKLNHFSKLFGTNANGIKPELNLGHKTSPTKISNGPEISQISSAISLLNGDIKHQSDVAVNTAKSSLHQLRSQSADSMSNQTANSSNKSDKNLNASKYTVSSVQFNYRKMNERMDLLSDHIIGIDTIIKKTNYPRIKMLISKRPESLKRVIGYLCAKCNFVAAKLGMVRNHITTCFRTKITNGQEMSQSSSVISLVNGDIKHQSVVAINTAKSSLHELRSQSSDSMSSQTVNSSIKSDKNLNTSKSTVLLKSNLKMNEKVDLLSDHVIGIDTENQKTDNPRIKKLISKKPESLKQMIGYRCAECDFAAAKLAMVRNHVTTCFRTKIKTSMVEREKLLNDHIIDIDTVEEVMHEKRNRYVSKLFSNKPESLNISIGYRCRECDFVAAILSHVKDHLKICHKDTNTLIKEKNLNLDHKSSDIIAKLTENKRVNDDIFNHNIITIDTVEKLTNNRLITSFLSNKLESFNKVIGYRCNWTHCNRIELDLDAIYAHIETFHNEFRPKCVDCDIYFDNGVQLQNHVRNAHTKRNNYAKHIESTIGKSDTKEMAKEVNEKNSDESAINDSECIVGNTADVDTEEVLMSDNRFIARIESPNGDIIGYVCKWPQCQHFVSEQSSIYEHYSTHKKDIIVNCSYCGVMCGSIKKFKKHQNNDDCDMNLNNKIKFNKHIIGFDTYDEIVANSNIAVVHSKRYNFDSNIIGFRCLFPDCDFVDKKKKVVIFHIRFHTITDN